MTIQGEWNSHAILVSKAQWVDRQLGIAVEIDEKDALSTAMIQSTQVMSTTSLVINDQTDTEDIAIFQKLQKSFADFNEVALRSFGKWRFDQASETKKLQAAYDNLHAVVQEIVNS